MQAYPDTLFREEQRVRDHKLFLVFAPVGFFLIVFFAFAMYRQLVGGVPFGNHPMGDGMLTAVGIVYIALGCGLLLLAYTGRLVTEVRPDGLFVRYYPFHRRFRHFRKSDLAGYEAVTYRPIRDFGGWGLRAGPRGKAYNVCGNRGVQLRFKNGRRLLIGSQRPESIVQSLDSIAD